MLFALQRAELARNLKSTPKREQHTKLLVFDDRNFPIKHQLIVNKHIVINESIVTVYGGYLSFLKGYSQFSTIFSANLCVLCVSAFGFLNEET